MILSSSFFIFILIAYFLGSIPFGLLLTKLVKQEDIRQIGSGNIGATNVLRTGKKGLALLTFLLDAGKGSLAVLATLKFGDTSFVPYVAVAVVSGHIFPIWLKFKGGKGVATAIGVFLTLSWQVGVITIFVWLSMAILTQYSSLASLFAAGFASLFSYKLTNHENFYAILAIAILILIRHSDNIKRLIKGEETKIGQNKKRIQNDTQGTGNTARES